MSPGGAFKAVQQAIRDIPKEAADEMRAIERERLDALHLAFWNRAMHGDVQAIGTVLKIIEARAKMFGLNLDAEVQPPAVIVKAYVGIDLGKL